MSQGPENRFISSVHDKLPPVDEFYRMKNHNEYNGGIADCWYSAKRDLWIEWKFVLLPVRDETMISIIDGKRPALSLLQQEWIRSRVHEGRDVWVGVGSVLGGVLFRGGWGAGRWTASEFRALIVPRADLAAQILAFCR